MTDQARGIQPVRDAVLLEVYLHELGYLPGVGGTPSRDVLEAVKRYQRDNDLVVDGIAGEKTWTKLFAANPQLTSRIAAKWLSGADLRRAAQNWDVPVATVRAVYKVESAGSGFWGLRPKILFEGHVFWRRLVASGKDPNTLRSGLEDVLFPTWNPRSYVGGPAEYNRLQRARQLDETAALESASWGLFQIMGFHAATLDYGDAGRFVESMNSGEGAHLEAFGRFIARNRFRGQSLLHWLRVRDWSRFAEGYNGSGFRRNRYDEKLQAAYEAAVADEGR